MFARGAAKWLGMLFFALGFLAACMAPPAMPQQGGSVAAGGMPHSSSAIRNEGGNNTSVALPSSQAATAVHIWMDDAPEGQALDYPGEGAQIALCTGTAYTNFAYALLQGDFSTTQEMTYYEKEVVYTAAQWQPGSPIYVAYWEVGDIFATYGISFDDQTGARRYFCIYTSGKDGTAYFEEYQNTPM